MLRSEITNVIEEVALLAEYLAATAEPDADFLRMHTENLYFHVRSLTQEGEGQLPAPRCPDHFCA